MSYPVLFRAALATLTPGERATLLSAYHSSAGNGHDFGITSDIRVPGFTQHAVGGFITSLQSKGIIVCEAVDSDDLRGMVQFALGNWGANDVLQGEWSPAAEVKTFLKLP